MQEHGPDMSDPELLRLFSHFARAQCPAELWNNATLRAGYAI